MRMSSWPGSNYSALRVGGIMKRMAFSKTVFLAILILMPLTSMAGMFDKGSKRFSLLIGSGQAFGDNYTIIGIGAGYYAYDGLELGINLDSWQGGSPDINEVTPEIRYVFRNQSSIDPYVGALYRWTFISGLDDLTAYGLRAGVYITTGRTSYMGIGVAYIENTDCDERIYISCSETYPELSIAFTF